MGKNMATAMAISFDTLAYTKKLKAAGVPERQAEAQAETLAEIVDERLATKKDLQEMEARFDTRINELSYKLTIRLSGIMGSMIMMAVAILTAIVKL
jgi:hypothetical protein